MTSIKPIDQGSIHRLHSGQVVLDLQGAIKELVENSLDAGATSIEVRIKDNGLDTVEIVDNGFGIGADDWPYIGRKHHTSKLSDIALIASVSTFGFRGEALSSLCALCGDVTVITATKDMAPMGAVLKFNRDGTLKDSTGRIARPRGTTVMLSGLFVPLPVRRKELERTAKREYTKALNLLYAYALVPASASIADGKSGVRFKVEAIGAGRSGKRSVILSTDGRGSLRSSVTAIWGPKALEGVLDIDLELEVETDSVMARREGLAPGSQQIKVDGLISSAAWGQGRSSPDRQYIYINNRPCDLKAVTKVINEIYKSFNTSQVPLAILNFHIPPESMDINVSPDKRTILLHSESNFIAALREGLERFFAPSRSDFQISGASQPVKVVQPTQTLLSLPRPEEVVTGEDVAPEEENQGVKRDDSMDAEEDDAEEEGDEEADTSSQSSHPELDIPTRRRTVRVPPEPPVADIPSNRTPFSRSLQLCGWNVSQSASSSSRAALHVQEMSFEGDIDTSPARPSQAQSRALRRQSSSSPPRAVKRTLDTTVASWSPERRPSASRGNVTVTLKTGKDARSNLRSRIAKFVSQSIHTEHEDDGDDESEVPGAEATPYVEVGSDEGEVEPDGDEHLDAYSEVLQSIDDISVDQDVAEQEGEMDETLTSVLGNVESAEDNKDPEPVNQSSTSSPINTKDAPSLPHRTSSDYRNEISTTSIQGELTLHFNLSRLRARYSSRATNPQTRRNKDVSTRLTEGSVATAAGILNRDPVQAEQALSRVIQKSDFGQMEVLGQFNKGFIIARLPRCDSQDESNAGDRGTDDLFIIDQHASDEKFNFETLQRTTIIKSQSLIMPRALQLTAGDEITAIENLETLKANGFEVSIDEDKAPGRGERVRLTAMPVSKDTTFDFKDLEQLLHLLAESPRLPGQTIRPQKIRAMFAMRACRKSVMIGKPLTVPQMTTLVRNMGTIDQPWNCPHGRPTMRHLSQLEASPAGRSGSGRIDWGSWKREPAEGS